MKKIVLALLCIAISSSLIIISTQYISNKNKIKIKEVNLENIAELMIGSELPKLLYADQEIVILDCGGVYVYDMKKKKLIRSFDISSLASISKEKRKWNCFVSQNGEQMIFVIGKGTSDDSMVFYCYDFNDNRTIEIDEKEYQGYRNKAFEWTDLDYNDKRYEKSSGRIVTISENEYVYVTFQDWRVSTIQVVYVKDNIEKYFDVFDNY